MFSTFPTASAGGPYSGNEGATIPITGTGSDPGGGTLSYAWDLNGDGVYTDATTATTSYSWGEPGVYTVSLRVTDSGGLTATASATVTVLNLPPTASAGGPYSGNEGATIPITGTGSDPGGGVLSYAWDLNSDGVFTDATTATTFYSWGEPGVYTVSLRVTDSGGLTATASATVTVYNLPPTASAGGPYTGTAGVPVTLTGTGSDPGGGVLTYTWDLNFDGQYGDAVGATVQYTWTIAAVYTVALRVEDSQRATATSTARVTIQPAALHYITISPDTATIQAGQSQTYTAAAYDAYGNWRGDVTTQTAFSILQAGHGGYWVDNVYFSRNPGTWTVVGTHSGISDTAVLTVLAPILNLVKADLTDPVDAGAFLTYTLTYSNTGNQTATGVVVTDTLDGNVTYSGATPAPSGFVGVNPYWTLGPLSPNASGQITLRVQVRTPLTNGTVLTNVAVIGCAQTTPVTAVQTTTVRSSPVLLLTKADGPDPVEAGAQLVYTLTYQNTGNEVARGVVVTDVLDIRTAFVGSIPPAQGSGQTRFWTLGDLAPGAPGTIRITTTVQSPLPNG
ncbi:MAG: PKD domain-containing protein, partial [Anaerolineae bacterium]|nr:PKD domain-containing protein [Anaerolineae bacterium]